MAQSTVQTHRWVSVHFFVYDKYIRRKQIYKDLAAEHKKNNPGILHHSTKQVLNYISLSFPKK